MSDHAKDVEYSKELKKLGSNPDILFREDGTIGIVSTLDKSKSFQMTWNISDYATN